LSMRDEWYRWTGHCRRSVFMTEHAAVFTADDLAQSQTPIASRVLQAGIRTVLSVPLRTSKGPLGTLNVGSRKDAAFSGEDQELMNQVAAQLAIALENARAYEEIENLKRRLEAEKHYLEGEIRTELHFEDIVGESRGLQRVLEQAKTVAPSGATVLLLARSRGKREQRYDSG
jgi:formate hydrogenlyase transcriptional activator